MNVLTAQQFNDHSDDDEEYEEVSDGDFAIDQDIDEDPVMMIHQPPIRKVKKKFKEEKKDDERPNEKPK